MTTWEKREGLLFYFSLFSHWGHNAGLGKLGTARLHLLLSSKMRSHWWQWIRRRGWSADQITGLPSSNQIWMFYNRSRNIVCLALSTWVEFLSFWGGIWRRSHPCPLFCITHHFPNTLKFDVLYPTVNGKPMSHIDFTHDCGLLCKWPKINKMKSGSLEENKHLLTRRLTSRLKEWVQNAVYTKDGRRMLPVLIESSQLWASILGVGIRGLNLKWKTRSREVASGEDHLL